MHKFIVANYKMNGDCKFYKSVAKEFNTLEVKDTKIVLCPPFVYLNEFKKLNKNISVGCQDVSCCAVGKCTGQISPIMLGEFNVQYAIIGHSERREIGETNSLVERKVKTALDGGLIPIVCVGELNKKSPISDVIEQVESVLNVCEQSTKIIFAYEPVWAIGSGEIPTNAKINKVVKAIKKAILKRKIEAVCLYGGSVNEKNYQKLIQCDIDGFLLGGVSLKTDKLIEIIKGV